MKYQLKLILIFISIFIISCSEEKLSEEQMNFKNKCLSNHHPWMKMSETKDGQIVGKACYGCMPDIKNHICNEQEYKVFVK